MRRSTRTAAVAAAAAALLAGPVVGCGERPSPRIVGDSVPAVATGRLPVARAGPGREFEIVTHTERDEIVAIDRPTFWSAERAAGRYRSDEPVIGVSTGGAARAYSLPFLSRHQVVNDMIGGRAVAVTWCPLCASAVVFARPTIDGVELDFGVSGKLVKNNLVLYDRQTDSQWSQILGEALYGPLRGQALEVVPALQTTWSMWRALHPHTEALATSGSIADPYSAYFAGPQAGARGEERRDDRLPTKTVVVGAVVDGRAVAVPVDRLAETVTLNDTIGEVAVLFIGDRATGTTAMFDRSVDGGDLTFRAVVGDGAGLVLEDAETGSQWLAWSGIAFDGPLAGKRLASVPSTRAYWFAWKDFHPETEVRGVPE